MPDVLAAVDDAVKRGIADPNRLCVEGWSYGAILTNYVIASDTRFKCAISGAGTSNILAGYGTDEYVRDYEAELGVPWKHADVWLKNSFPFLHADRIKTPVLFMGGDKDFNVPLLNVEQMYQAVKSLGLESQLIVLSRPVSRHHAAERPEGPHGPRHRVDQQASERQQMSVESAPATLDQSLGLDTVVDRGKESGRSMIHYRATPAMCHSGNIVQGGFVTGWMDAAMAYVTMAATDYEFSPLSLEIKVSFFQSARAGINIAEAWIEKRGRKTVFLEATLKNEAGELLAKSSSTAKLVPVKR
ncbi:MAG: prolyl oligopeptidase family serine peptidase [Rhizomicrobium sp.]